MDKTIDSFINGVEKLFDEVKPGEDGFGVQFMKIKQQSVLFKQKYPSTVGEKAENKKKNRYKDILPFDHCRVSLPSSEENSSDYINASFIKSPNNTRAYIASQGPLPHTVNDFWRMLWYYKVKVIIMVCRQEEQGKQKCERYWSSGADDKKIFEDIAVTLISIEDHEFGFLHRQLQVTKGKETRLVHQFQYKAWPDHGVPRTRDAILTLINEARSYQDYKCDETSPLCVHCSAGCGRTGVVIVIDYFRHILYDQSLLEDLTVHNLVIKLRQQRPSIVQTREQYEFVHLAVSEMFTKYMKSHGKYLSANLSKSLTDTNYENVTIPEKSKPNQKQTKTSGFPLHKKHGQTTVGSNYENVEFPEIDASQSKHGDLLGQESLVPPPKPHRPPIQSRSRPMSTLEPLECRSNDTGHSFAKPQPVPRKFSDTKLISASDQEYLNFQHTKSNNFSSKLSDEQSKSVHSSTAMSKSRARGSHATNPGDNSTVGHPLADKVDIFVSESIQARKERLQSHGLLPSNVKLQKTSDVSHSVSDLRLLDNSSFTLSNQPLQRSTSIHDAIQSLFELENNNSNNKKLFPSTKSKPPVLPKKFQSSKLNSDSAKKANVKSYFDCIEPSSGSNNDNQCPYTSLSSTQKQLNPAYYDVLKHSVKVHNKNKSAMIDAVKSSEENKNKQAVKVVSTSTTNDLPKTSVVHPVTAASNLSTFSAEISSEKNLFSPSKSPRKNIHLYSFVPDEVLSQEKDQSTKSSATTKPALPTKPNLSLKETSNNKVPQVYEKEDDINTDSTGAQQYAMAQDNLIEHDPYASITNNNVEASASVANVKESVYYTIATEESHDCSSDSSFNQQGDAYAQFVAKKTVATHSSLNASSHLLPDTPPIPERTPESQMFIDSAAQSVPTKTTESETLISSVQAHSSSGQYEEVVTNTKPNSENSKSRSSNPNVGNPLSGMKAALGKTKNVFNSKVNTLQHIGSGNKDESNRVHRSGVGGYTQEQVMYRNQDIKLVEVCGLADTLDISNTDLSLSTDLCRSDLPETTV